jgi:fluoride exporter
MSRARRAIDGRRFPIGEDSFFIREHREPSGRPAEIHPRSALFAVAAGGAIGAMLRHFFVLAFPRSPGGFPLVTFAENVTGAFLLGAVLIALLRSPRLAARWRPFLATGILGSFTTFSTVSLQIVRMVVEGEAGAALYYVTASFAAGFAAAAAGIVTGAALMDRVRAAR